MRKWIRTRIPGSEVAYETFRRRLRARNTLSRAQGLIRERSAIRLDIGAGDVVRLGWVTLDISDKCDLFWDLRWGIPFPDGTVDIVYSSHLLEHMSHEAGQNVLREAWRVLKSGGTLSTCVPNARLYVDAYLGSRPLADDHDFWEPALVSRSGIDLLNYIAYMGGEHACMFDEVSLVSRIREAGFIDVQLRSFDAELDLPERQFESIYAQAVKP